ncbi:NPP1 family protein [Streptomonospora nanhaiensis]|uniref:NPP1 family protein n=1 Tax=Streptomonospora nanhaiensis TaxID=1323731 RepID=UPI001C990C54|nr:NPP1 family protein [Streptomonospora nanhaiensis]MBX9388458.1 NPP1 family protein [Streptomonospora nanhaiensis]
MSTQSDLELLRAYEPVLVYTRGELFFPADVDAYVRCCSLWCEDRDGKEVEVVPAGELTLDRLATAEQEWPGRYKHLRFVQDASLRAEARRHRRSARRVIPRSGRLAAVGVLGRVVDILMKLSLLIRGAVPGGVAAAAATRYRDRVHIDGTASYYGRVVREGGYIALQYWYFYAMNDWRSTYGGVNDHEADWEKVTVYVVEDSEGRTRPMWVGASSHEYFGDDLRRSWDDPDLRREGDHPVIFVGAGSHSHQMLPGDYLIQVDPAVLRWVVRAWRWVGERIFRSDSQFVRHGIGVPFVDYARGDGVRVGPGGERTWTAHVIDDDTPWVRGFRGLWGRDTGDFFEGERAPSGPRYERDGTIRWSWADPLAWVGLQKVPPTEAAARVQLAAHLGDLEERIREADADILRRRDALRRLTAARLVLGHDAHSQSRAQEYDARIRADEKELSAAYRRRAMMSDERDSCRAALDGEVPVAPSPTEHLRAPHLPYATGQQRTTRFLHVWAALSTPLLICALGAMLFLQGTYTAPAMIGVVLVFAMVDAMARRKLMPFLTGLAVLVLAVGVVAGIIAAFAADWRIALLVPTGVVVAILLWVNVRDLIRG